MVFLCAFGLSMLAVIALTPAVRSLATRLRFLDYPNRQKVHATPTPLMGGVAVALASLASASAALALIRCPYSARIVGFMSGGLMVIVLGLADDANGMRPATKLAGQSAAALVMLLSGGVDGIPLPLPLAYGLALFWMVGLMNAFNFLDNMDGITSGLAAIATFGIFTLALGNGHVPTAIAAISVAGGALGFLRYNSSPASIFLGDAGSLFLGYVVGGLSLRAVANAGTGASSLLVPVLMLGYPIFDATLVTVSRLMDGRRLSEGGRDHSSHRLARLGLSSRQTALAIYIMSLSLTATAVVVSRFMGRSPVVLPLATIAAAGGMAFLGLRLFRVPVTAGMVQSAPGARRVAIRIPDRDDLAILVPRDRVYTGGRRSRRPSETVEVR
ncbi:MAG: undecaprenyl/decaprenyl-phosphate alpha-N-acetylglucosaminyl 1-phosphate transferase [Candidatus Eisenbacteria bacterium]|nr:undecaprenyl/decaprenyl-phosphate alpha-N-acetylglucosaminyl 1-phosphate transferase [Candidatus Eisenbacteria bacterium]